MGNAVREALEKARLALVANHGLWATDKPGEYQTALVEGCDSEGAYNCQQEVSWSIDNSAEIAAIDAVLAERSDATPAVAVAARRHSNGDTSNG